MIWYLLKLSLYFLFFKKENIFSWLFILSPKLTSVLYRIGTEHEKFGFEVDTLRPIKYDQIRDILNGLAERFDWDKIMEGDNVIGLKQVLFHLLLPFCMNIMWLLYIIHQQLKLDGKGVIIHQQLKLDGKGIAHHFDGSLSFICFS